MATSAPLTIHLWVPNCAPGTGGIQSFSRCLIQAVAAEFPEARLRVISMNDVVAPPLEQDTREFTFHAAGSWPGKLRSLYFTAQLLKAALLERPDLILSTHVNFTPVARWLKQVYRIPYTAVAHGVDVWGLQNRKVIDGIRKANRILAVSRFTRESLLREMALPPELVHVFPNTVVADEFRLGPKPDYLLKRYGLQPDQPTILTVTRLAGEERYKGYEQVLEALPELQKRVPNVRYVLGGKGDDKPRIEALIKERGLESCVTLAGFIPEAELTDHYNLCDVFAMPSRKEGFGIVFLEAMVCGKPVIAGNQDGSVDPLVDGQMGVLINPESVPELTDALAAVLTGTHPLAILRDPVALREQTIARFGFEAFRKATCRELLPFVAGTPSSHKVEDAPSRPFGNDSERGRS